MECRKQKSSLKLSYFLEFWGRLYSSSFGFQIYEVLIFQGTSCICSRFLPVLGLKLRIQLFFTKRIYRFYKNLKYKQRLQLLCIQILEHGFQIIFFFMKTIVHFIMHVHFMLNFIISVKLNNQRAIMLKKLRFSRKLKWSDPYILATRWCTPLIDDLKKDESTTFCFKNIENRKFEFVAKTQFVSCTFSC